MPYQIVDTVTAQSLQDDLAQSLFAWIVMRDLSEYPRLFVARLVADTPTPFAVLGQTLDELRAQLPPGLERVDRQPADPMNVVEVWCPV
jgi:hypothetical protein